LAAPVSDTYRTIAAPAEGLYKEKGSKFIGLAFPVASEEEVKNIYAELKKTYFDARHHCFAYVLGTAGSRYRANDDGEPNHTAGDPILGQIRSAGLTQVLVVVVRYFGGTKLGVSGLIQAYRQAAAEALAAAQVVEKAETVALGIAFDYGQMNEVMRLVKDFKLEVVKQDLALRCYLVVETRRHLAGLVLEKLAGISTSTLLEGP
jgi:uncharacterized YigZ family protein